MMEQNINEAIEELERAKRYLNMEHVDEKTRNKMVAGAMTHVKDRADLVIREAAERYRELKEK